MIATQEHPCPDTYLSTSSPTPLLCLISWFSAERLLPSGKIHENLFPSLVITEQNKNLPVPFERRSNLNFLPPSSQELHHLTKTSSLQKDYTPSNKQRKVNSPNLIHAERLLPLSSIMPLNFPPPPLQKEQRTLSPLQPDTYLHLLHL